MRALIILTVDVPRLEDVADVILALDPPSVPHFTGEVRVTVGPDAAAVVRYLDTEPVDRMPLEP